VAILLVTAQDRDCPDPAARWTAGTVVCVHEDGHEFGRKELPEAGLFVHVVVADRTPQQCQKYLEEVRTELDLKIKRRRRYCINAQGMERIHAAGGRLVVTYGELSRMTTDHGPK